MEKQLVHVVSFTLRSEESVRAILSHLGRLIPRQQMLRCNLLLFCDLPDAPAARLPEEEPVLRQLLQGITAMNARLKGCFSLLVRSRVWDNASRQYLGAGQALSPRQVIAQLLARGKTPAAFDSASIDPASLKGKYDAVLFSSEQWTCTPDMPMRMLSALDSACEGAVGARVLSRDAYPRSVLSRLCAPGCFSFSPVCCAQKYALLRRQRCPAQNPVMYTAAALASEMAASVPLAKDCFFVQKQPPTLRWLLEEYRHLCRTQESAWLLLPWLQLFALFLSALTGFPILAAAALIPEIGSLVHPRQWPGMLLRTAFLPLTALLSLDALLCRLFARSPLLRIRVPESLLSPTGCMLTAGLLLPAAFLSVHALAVLLPIALLWLSTPLLVQALDRPTLERIPLDAQDLSHLHSLAEGAYFDAAQAASPSPALSVLTACAGCMLDLLEPDEAARHALNLLETDIPCRAAAEQAALLASAQYLRERAQDCDAALRPLPERLEALVLAAPPEGTGVLASLLRAVHDEAFFSMTEEENTDPMDRLFLPLGPAKETAQHPLSLPLTHPHTFLSRQLLETSDKRADMSDHALGRFLFLAAAALGHPFYALLLRSPVAGAYVGIRSGIRSGISSPNP